MMRLLDHILLRSDDDPVWVRADDVISAGTLRAAVRQVRCEHESLHGAAVAVCCRDSFGTAHALVALDGFVARLLIISPGMEPGQVALFLQQTGIETVVGDRDDLAAAGIAIEPLRFATAESGGRGGEVHDTEWLIATSGTTDTPKLVAHTLHSLSRTVKTDVAVGRRLRWGLLYDLTRFAGLQVFLQGLLGGSALVFADDADTADDQVDRLAAGDCTALSATPTMWRRLLMTNRLDAVPLRIASLGGEIADRAVLRALRRTFPEARLAHIYASTEAGVGFSVTDGEPGFPASFLGDAPGGVDIRVDDEGFLYVRPASGREQRYIGRDESIADEHGWINTNDLVTREGNRFLFVGRANGAINVGGNKVHPAEVEEVIHEVPGVAQVAIRAKRSAFTGSLVEALIVPDGTIAEADLESAVRAACTSQLAPYKVPALYRVVPSLEINRAGKLIR